MRLFFGNIILALLFMLLMDTVSLSGLVTGFVFGFIALWFSKPVMTANTTYFSTLIRVCSLVLFFIKELWISSVRVAWDVITPTDHSRPKVIRMPLDVESDLEVFLVANLISLTPGTLTLDVDEVNRQLIIHAMFADDEEALIKELKDGMEYQVKHVFEGIS